MAERDSEVGPFERLWEEWRSESRNRDAVKRGKLRVTWADVMQLFSNHSDGNEYKMGCHGLREKRTIQLI